MFSPKILSILISCAGIANSQLSSTRRPTSIKSTEPTSTSIPDTKGVIPKPAVTPTGDPNDFSCCFIVIDDIEEVSWNRWHTETTYSTVKLTSYTTYKTPYPTTTVTSIDTNIYTTSATLYWSTRWDRDVALYSNADGVKYANQTMILPNPDTELTLGTTPVVRTISETVLHGFTVQSPDAYYIYSKFRIMTAGAVKDDSGRVACATNSITGKSSQVVTATSASILRSTPSTTIVQTQTIYGSVGANSGVPISSVIKTVIISQPVLTFEASIYTTDNRITFEGVNTKLHEYFMKDGTVTQDGVKIALETPFFYMPERGNVPKLDDSDYMSGSDYGNCNPQGPPMVNYGYPPPDFLQYLYTNEEVLAQYPRIKDCAAGGPPVLPVTSICTAPARRSFGGDLTQSTIIIVNPTSGAVAPPANLPLEPANTQVPPVLTDSPEEQGSNPLATPTKKLSPQNGPVQQPAPSEIQNPTTSVPPSILPAVTQDQGTISSPQESPQQPSILSANTDVSVSPVVAPPQSTQQPPYGGPASGWSNFTIVIPAQTTQNPLEGSEVPDPTTLVVFANTQQTFASQLGSQVPNPVIPGQTSSLDQTSTVQQITSIVNVDGQPTQITLPDGNDLSSFTIPESGPATTSIDGLPTFTISQLSSILAQPVTETTVIDGTTSLIIIQPSASSDEPETATTVIDGTTSLIIVRPSALPEESITSTTIVNGTTSLSIVQPTSSLEEPVFTSTLSDGVITTVISSQPSPSLGSSTQTMNTSVESSALAGISFTTVLDGISTTLAPGEIITTILGAAFSTIANTDVEESLTTTVNGVETTLAPAQTLTTLLGGVLTTISNPASSQLATTVNNNVPTTLISSKQTANPTNLGDLIESFLGNRPTSRTTDTQEEPTLISGVPNVLVTAEATIPLSDAAGADGRTTVINGETNVIVQLSTYVPLVPGTESSTSTSVPSPTTSAPNEPTGPLQAPPQNAGTKIRLGWLHWNAAIIVLSLYALVVL